MVALGITHGLRWFFVLGMGVFSPRFPLFRSLIANCLSRLENRAVGSFVSGRQNHLCFCYLVVFVAHCLLFIQKARAGVLDGTVPLIGCALKVAVSVLLIGHQSATV